MAGRDKGIYVLEVELQRPLYMLEHELSRGVYLYVGRAMNGLSIRLSRYMKSIKKPHWHVDWLLMSGRLLEVASALTNDPKMEHELACLLASSHEYVPRFGSSDDDCPSHLFRGEIGDAVNAMKILGLEPRIYRVQQDWQ